MNMFYKKDVKKLLSDLETAYKQQEAVVEHLRDQLKHFRQDEEIQRLENEIQELRHLSLLIFTPKERVAVDAFRKRHYEKCGDYSTFRYELIGTAVGTRVAIICPHCGETEEVTDFDSF